MKKIAKKRYKSKKSIWKKWWFWLMVAVFAFVLLLLLSENNIKEELPELEQITETKEEPEIKEEKVLTEYSFDVPLLLNKNAFEIKEILDQKYREPISIWEPTEAMFGATPGAMSWLDEKSGLIFSFEYWPDGSINNNLFFLSGAKEQGHTIESVLKAGRLKEGEPDYKIEINPLAIAEMVDVWIRPTKE